MVITSITQHPGPEKPARTYSPRNPELIDDEHLPGLSRRPTSFPTILLEKPADMT